MALWGALTGGANIVIHAAGWLEGGLSASYEKFILDVEQLQHMAELMQPVRFDPGELALDAIRGGRLGRAPFLRHRAHDGTVRDRVLRATGV